MKSLKTVNKNLGKIFSGGYKSKSYSNNPALLGNIICLIEMKIEELMNIFKSNVIDRLDDGTSYSMLINVVYSGDGIIKGTSPIKSIILTKNSDLVLISRTILNSLHKCSREYNIKNEKAKIKV